VDDDGHHQSTYLTKQKIERKKKKRKQCSYHLEELHGTSPILTVVGLNFAIRRRGQELYDLC
jgi:hypothetical protein